METLGEGAFGAVHLAEVTAEEGFVQRLAVKWLQPQWSQDRELMARLRDEARLLALLDHPNVVKVHGLTRLSGRLAILMEAVDGVDLSRLGDEPVPPRCVVGIVGAVADALDAAWQATSPGSNHPLRVVHRDIKPSNVMITTRGHVKVMDFGVARATFESREAQTRSQQFGTARYMAPERWLDGVCDARSDVFSLGIAAIELASGRPVERPRLSVDGFTQDLARALESLPDVPALRALLEQMTAFAPGARPTAADVADQCRRLAQDLSGPDLRGWASEAVPRLRVRRVSQADGTQVTEDDASETFDADAPPVVATPVSIGPGTARPLRGTRVAVGLGVGLVLAIAAIGGLRRTNETPPAPAAAAPALGPTVARDAGPIPPTPAAVDPAAVDPVAVDPAAVEPTAPPTTSRKLRPPAQKDPAPTASGVVPAPVATPVLLKFEFDSHLSVVTGSGVPIPPRRGVPFARGSVINLVVTDGARRTTCTVTADPTKPTVRIGAAGCAQ